MIFPSFFSLPIPDPEAQPQHSSSSARKKSKLWTALSLMTPIIQQNFLPMTLGLDLSGDQNIKECWASRVHREEAFQPLILQMRPPKHREGKKLIQGHTARLWQSKGLHQFPDRQFPTQCSQVSYHHDIANTTENPRPRAWVLQHLP